jgi:hypothetical protein
VRNVLAGFIVLLCATSAAAIDSHLFYLGMSGGDFDCVGVELAIGGSTYTVKAGAASQLHGPTNSSFSSGSLVAAKARWYAGGTCGGSTEDLCAAKQFALGKGSGTICTQAVSDGVTRNVGYDVSQYTTGGHTYWKINFSSSTSGGGVVQ